MNKRKSIFVLSSAALASAVLFGVAASSTFLKVNDSIGADAAAFSAPAADFNLVGEEYVGVAVGDGGNSVRAKISGVTKNEDGLTIAAGQYACFTNIDPLRSIDAIGLTFGTKVSGLESNGLLFFSSLPLELEKIFAGFYSDIYYTPFSAYHGSGAWSYNLPMDLNQSYRYVLGLIDAPMESPIVINSLSFSTPCANEPEPAKEGTFTDWDDDVKADMTSVIGAPLPALGHNVYNFSPAYHQVDFATANMLAAQTYYESILAQGYSMNYSQPYGSTAFMFILQKRLPEDKVASIQFAIYMTPSGLSRAMLAYTDAMDWMGSIDHWPAENIAAHLSSDLAAALAPLEFEGISFLEAAESSEFAKRLSYLITPIEGMTSEVVSSWAAAMETKGWGVSMSTYGSDTQVTCRMADHPNWEVMLSVSPSHSQSVLNIAESTLTTSFPVDALRAKFGENIPDFAVSSTYVFESYSSPERIRFTAYGLAYADVLPYLDSLVDAGYILLNQSNNYFRAIDLVRGVEASVYGNGGSIAFDFCSGSSTSMENFVSFADLALSTVKSSYSVDPNGFDYSLLPVIPEGAEVRAVSPNGQMTALITKAGQDFIDALNAMSTVDPITGGRVLLENGNNGQLLLLDASLGDGYCIVKLAAMRGLETVNYEVVNEFITNRVQDNIEEFSPVLLEKTDAPFILQGDRVCFLDGSGDAALASLRAALAADSRFVYSPVDDAYVVPGKYFAYSFSHEDYELPSRTVLRVGYYPFAVAADYVSVNDLSGEVKTLLGHFPALPDCGEKYLNVGVANVSPIGEEGEVYIADDFDASSYFASLETAGFQKHEGNYFREEGGYFYSVRETSTYANGHQYRALAFGYYPFLAENAFSSTVGEKVASTLPSSFDSAPFFCMTSYEDMFVWKAPSTYDLSTLSEAMLAKGWKITSDEPTAKEFSRLDTVTGIMATLRVLEDDIGIRFEYRMAFYDFDFVPTKLGLCELGVDIRFVDSLLAAVLPDDGTIGYRDGGYDRLSLLAVGIDYDAYCGKLDEQGMKVYEDKEGGAEAYDGATGMRYKIEKVSEGCYQINIYGVWNPNSLVVSDEDFAAYANTKGFADVAPNLGSAIMMDNFEKITFDTDYLEIAFYGGWNVGESTTEEYLAGQGYAKQVDPFDEKNPYYVRTDANYEYRVYLDGPTRLVITRL